MKNIMTTTKIGSFADLKERLEKWIKQGNQQPLIWKEKDEWLDGKLVEWKQEGLEYREQRKALGVKVKDIASMLGVSVSRIYNLEKGLPIRDAKLLKNAYELALGKLTEKYTKVLLGEISVDSGK
jgi:DNA-binding XRE family transcriptional regulator